MPSTGRASKFAAFHFHNPVWIANVVDIVPHAGTAPELLNILHGFAISIGQIPVLINKKSKGYIFNTILDGIIRSSLDLASNDVASVYDIDRAWMGITKMAIFLTTSPPDREFLEPLYGEWIV